MATYPITNAPQQNLTMNDFLAINKRYGGLAKSCRFVAVIRPQGSTLVSKTSYMDPRELMYLCEAAEFPGRLFEAVDLRYYGPNFKLPFQSRYEDLTMTFLCRNGGFERQFFDDWMEIINPTTTFDFEYRDNYRARIEIYQYEDQGLTNFLTGEGLMLPVYSFTLNEAYPVMVNPQPVTWADDQFLRLGITFTYSWWTRNGRDQPPRNSAGTNASFRLVPDSYGLTVDNPTVNPQNRTGL